MIKLTDGTGQFDHGDLMKIANVVETFQWQLPSTIHKETPSDPVYTAGSLLASQE